MMKEKYTIRILDKKDISSVVTIVRRSFDSEYLIPSIYRGKGIERFISDELENTFSPYKYFVLCDDKSVVGYAEFKIFESLSMAFLNIISVSDVYKNKGIGRKLFEYCREYFLKNGIKSIQLDVYKTNTIALNWYSGFGFNIINSNSFYSIELRKEVANPHNIYIQNYPQYKELQKILGFYFLDVIMGSEHVKLGIIESDFFLRGNYNPSLNAQLSYLSKVMKIKNLYFIGNKCEFEECKFINEIIRMELNIKL